MKQLPSPALIVFGCLLAALPASAQEKQGNIVEYFGKEKVTDTVEGTAIHTFTKGLVMGGSRASRNTGSTPKEPIVASLLLDPTFRIEEGTEGRRSRGGDVMKWETIEADEKQEFSDRRLRSGYLYLEYDSAGEQTVLLDASGSTKVFVNGLPHEGDHYDFGWSLIPIHLKAGSNNLLMTGGRFSRMRARLLVPKAPVQLTPRDKTLPDILVEDDAVLLGGIRIVNASNDWFAGTIECELGGNSRTTEIARVSPLNTRKVAFQIPSPSNPDGEKQSASVILKNAAGTELSRLGIVLNVRSQHAHHKRTFLSRIDQSVQYYAVAPCTNHELAKPAMFLSVHGASVEATGQAAAYKQKDWGHLVAPTNRRPFGFAWEDWGRLDALEVLNHAEQLFDTDQQRTYLTGHSMGGHGTWYLGATYPDRFAAIGPAAGYPDLLSYRDSFRHRLKTASDEDLERFGMTRKRADQMVKEMESKTVEHPDMDAMIRRAGNPSRTLKLQRNYLQQGVYILHGEKDTVVPTYLAREMREVLAKFHPDFCYYEYPGGTHWYGNHSVDWQPLFDFFQFRKIKASEEIEKLEFHTASPGVSASSHFVTIIQQVNPFEISSFQFERGELPKLTFANVSAVSVDLKKMGQPDKIKVTDQEFDVKRREAISLKLDGDSWTLVEEIPKSEKGPHRSGGFKDAFRHGLMLVYATGGSASENTWYYHRAKHDAETFYYRANGNVEIVPDTDFVSANHVDRNVILYGNQDNNAAWESLLQGAPLQVANGSLQLGDRTLTGDHYGAYVIYPRKDSAFASVGVVTATGDRGMKAAYSNHYLVNGTSFPDVLIFDDKVLAEGLDGVTASGFFGNDWSVENGDFVWKSSE